jgi:hypothetical protein
MRHRRSLERGRPPLLPRPTAPRRRSTRVTKLAGQMLDELRREVFFRAGSELRAIGRGKRWLLLRAWERTSDSQTIRS